MTTKQVVMLPINKVIFGNSRTNEKKVSMIANQLDTRKFKCVPAFWDGKGYVLTDGNHRVKAAVRCGYSHVPAILLTKQEFDYVKFSKRTINCLVNVPPNNELQIL